MWIWAWELAFSELVGTHYPMQWVPMLQIKLVQTHIGTSSVCHSISFLCSLGGGGIKTGWGENQTVLSFGSSTRDLNNWFQILPALANRWFQNSIGMPTPDSNIVLECSVHTNLLLAITSVLQSAINHILQILWLIQVYSVFNLHDKSMLKRCFCIRGES